MGTIYTAICATVIMNVAYNNNNLISPARMEKPGKIKIRSHGVTSFFSGKFPVTVDCASPHGRSYMQNNMCSFRKIGGNRPFVIASPHQK